ncbi:histidine kinase, partial [bacterium]
LGEELVPDVDQGIIELVKNAYDADAANCTISLNPGGDGHGSILIEDTGNGMSDQNLRFGWLVIGRSGKKEKTPTSRYGRMPVGDKGLGRLAALRLGRRVLLKTRPREEPGVEYRLVLDWDAFELATVIEEVPIEVSRVATDKSHGTDILIDSLKSPISRTTANKLARNLLLLADPFSEEGTVAPVSLGSTEDDVGEDYEPDPGFRPELMVVDYADLAAKVRQSYFSDAEYRIQALLDEGGRARFRLLDWKGEVLHEQTPESVYAAPAFAFDLWVFILEGGRFSTKSATMKEVKAWLGQVGGVHIYEDGIRVPPYGGAGDDWLDLNLRRARSPEMRPSTNTAVGRVRVSNLDRRLVQKTDRIGYIETESFLEIRRCCSDAVEWAARLRTRERDHKRQTERKADKEKTEGAARRLEAVISKAVPVTQRKQVEDAVQQYVKDVGRDTKSLRQEIQLYRSMATAGMTTAIFSHEVGRPLTMIDGAIKAILKLVPAADQEKAASRVSRIQEAKRRVNSFVSIPLSLLEKRKRRVGRVTVNAAISRLATLIAPVIDYYKVTLTLDLTEDYTDISGSDALIDGICLNFVMNSINAFQRVGHPQNDRRIWISTTYDG